MESIGDAVAEGKKVTFLGFGTFEPRSRSARTGRNPKTGEEVPIPPRRVLAFRASAMLKSRLNRAGEAVMRNARQRRAR